MLDLFKGGKPVISSIPRYNFKLTVVFCRTQAVSFALYYYPPVVFTKHSLIMIKELSPSGKLRIEFGLILIRILTEL